MNLEIEACLKFIITVAILKENHDNNMKTHNNFPVWLCLVLTFAMLSTFLALANCMFECVHEEERNLKGTLTDAQ